MNAFRITILVLLTLAVGMMFYFIQVSQPAMQNESDAYWAQKNSEELSQQVSTGNAAPAANSALEEELARKREEQQKAAKAQEEAAFREMERSTVEEQTRQEQARRQRETEKAVIQPPVIGRVYSCDEQWGVVTIESTSGKRFPAGLEVFIMREGRAVGEATINSQDAETGLYIAYIKDIVISTKRKDATPQQGDQVVVMDIPSAAELRGETDASQLKASEMFDEVNKASINAWPVPQDEPQPAGQTPAAEQTPAETPAAQPAPVPAPTPAPAPEQDPDYGLPSLPEVEGTLTPVP